MSPDRFVRLGFVVAVAFVALAVLSFVVRTGLAAWSVFPPPVPDPSPPVATAAVARAVELAPGEARYRSMSAQLLLREFRGSWTEADAIELGIRASEAADRAADLLPTNPYLLRRSAAVALELARHPRISEQRAEQLRGAAVRRMRAALEHSGRIPAIPETVALDLIRAWEELDEAGRETVRAAIRQAASLNASSLNRTLEALWTRALAGQTLERDGNRSSWDPERAARVVDVLESVTPDTPAAQEVFGRFLGRRAGSIDPDAGSSVDTVFEDTVLRAYERAARGSDYELQRLTLWLGALQQREDERFREVVEKLTERLSERPEIWLAVSDPRYEIGDRDDRIRALDRAIALLRGRPSDKADDGASRRDLLRAALHRRARLHAEASAFPAALADYEALSEIDPLDPAPLLEAAQCLSELGRGDEALEALERASRVAPRSSVVRKRLAKEHERRLEFVDAIDEWSAVTSIAPKSPEAFFQIGENYRRLGLDERALEAYREALRLSPDDPEIRKAIDDIVRREEE